MANARKSDRLIKIKRISRIPRAQRIVVRRDDMPIARGRRGRPIEWGEDPLEQRAIPKEWFPGATLPERIVYKKLMQLIGEENFIFQRSINGGRNIIGGYSIDFLVTIIQPGIAIEPIEDFWHQEKDKWRDIERALVLTKLGYEYYEITNDQLYPSDEVLEDRLMEILGRYVVDPMGKLRRF